MIVRYSDLTKEHFGDGATDATVDQFVQACEEAVRVHPDLCSWDEDGNLEEEGVIDYVWHGGDFGVRIRELLDEDIVSDDG